MNMKKALSWRLAFAKKWPYTLYDLETHEDREDLHEKYVPECMGELI